MSERESVLASREQIALRSVIEAAEKHVENLRWLGYAAGQQKARWIEDDIKTLRELLPESSRG